MDRPPTDSESPPLPKEGARERVAGTTDPEWFDRSGEQTLEDFRTALARVDDALEDHERILDFGCGCGRLLRWMRPLAAGRSIHGCDIDVESVEWVREHLPEFDVRVNDPLPSLSYPTGFFDLILCHSVFTHLDEEYQDAWLQELRRIAADGALLVISFSGDHVFEERVQEAIHHGTDPSPFRERRERDGILFLRDEKLPFAEFYQATYHAPWYVFRRWSRTFRVRAHLERGALGFQDLVVLEREPRAVQPGHRSDSSGVARAKQALRGLPGARGARRTLRRWSR